MTFSSMMMVCLSISLWSWFYNVYIYIIVNLLLSEFELAPELTDLSYLGLLLRVHDDLLLLHLVLQNVLLTEIPRRQVVLDDGELVVQVLLLLLLSFLDLTLVFLLIFNLLHLTLNFVLLHLPHCF
jgi:hypothetical protein